MRIYLVQCSPTRNSHLWCFSFELIINNIKISGGWSPTNFLHLQYMKHISTVQPPTACACVITCWELRLGWKWSGQRGKEAGCTVWLWASTLSVMITVWIAEWRDFLTNLIHCKYSITFTLADSSLILLFRSLSSLVVKLHQFHKCGWNKST